MNLSRVTTIGISVFVGVSLFFFNVNTDEMKGVKGVAFYAMLYFTVSGIESTLNLIYKKMGGCSNGN
ncbi:hypothetical protein [Vibrio alfacsensis]|uniref:hypothetical protein n=1 Tax=Vibrio alfacsensis TaxID=1074311 RepID=UPI0040682855